MAKAQLGAPALCALTEAAHDHRNWLAAAHAAGTLAVWWSSSGLS